MKSKKLQMNPKTHILVGECICKKCDYRNGRNFKFCLKRKEIPSSIILGDEECHFYKQDSQTG